MIIATFADDAAILLAMAEELGGVTQNVIKQMMKLLTGKLNELKSTDINFNNTKHGIFYLSQSIIILFPIKKLKIVKYTLKTVNARL